MSSSVTTDSDIFELHQDYRVRQKQETDTIENSSILKLALNFKSLNGLLEANAKQTEMAILYSLSYIVIALFTMKNEKPQPMYFVKFFLCCISSSKNLYTLI